YTIEGVLHALCNAHHLRELKALVEIEKEEWARKMQRLLRRACHVTNSARERGVPLRPRLIACFERRYDAILAEGLAFHETQLPLVRTVIKGGGKRRGCAPRRTGHNLLLRLAKRKEDTLRFLRDADNLSSNHRRNIPEIGWSEGPMRRILSRCCCARAASGHAAAAPPRRMINSRRFGWPPGNWGQHWQRSTQGDRNHHVPSQ